MERAIDETNRRRDKQRRFNKEHGITPLTIVKQVADVMEAAYPSPQSGRRKAAEKRPRYETMSPAELIKQAVKLEKQMLKHARELEFEEAARLRDEIQALRELGLGLSDRKAG